MTISEEKGHEIAEAALSLVGTPYRHQGRLPSVGLDCAGVVLAALASAGIAASEPGPYRVDPDPAVLAVSLATSCAAVPDGDIRPGDVLAFSLREGAPPKHLAVYVGDGRMVHVFGRCARVQLAALAPWHGQLVSAWRPKWHR